MRPSLFDTRTRTISASPVHLVAMVAALCLALFSASAQNAPATGNKWKFLAEPYLMFPNMNGSMGISDLPDTKVDANAGDIFSKLQFGAMVYFEAGIDRWAVTSDMLYMNLKQDVTPGTLIKSGNVGSKQFAWEVAGLYKILPWLEGGVGGGLNSLNMEANIVQREVGGGHHRKKQIP